MMCCNVFVSQKYITITLIYKMYIYKTSNINITMKNIPLDSIYFDLLFIYFEIVLWLFMLKLFEGYYMIYDILVNI